MCRRRPDGYLIIDFNNEEAPVQLRLNLGINELAKRKQIHLDVDASAIQNLDGGLDMEIGINTGSDQ